MNRPLIIDCRSGQHVSVGDWVRYPPPVDGTSGLPLGAPDEDDWKLLDIVQVRLFSADLLIGKPVGKPQLAARVQLCPVRWFHPAGNGAWRVILVPT